MNNDLNNLKEMVKFKSLNKWYGDFHALKDIDLNIEQGAVSYTHLTLPTTMLV